jgi:hypothetical protein
MCLCWVEERVEQIEKGEAALKSIRGIVRELDLELRADPKAQAKLRDIFLFLRES